MGLFKNTNQIFEEHNFSIWRRYIVTGSYPEPKYGIWHKRGDIIECHNPERIVGESFYIDNPAIFKPLSWWDNRTFEEMFSIKIVQMLDSQYWIPGDILEVDSYEISKTNDPKFIGYRVGSQVLKPSDVLPLRKYQQYDRIRSKQIMVKSA